MAMKQAQHLTLEDIGKTVLFIGPDARDQRWKGELQGIQFSSGFGVHLTIDNKGFYPTPDQEIELFDPPAADPIV
ncbi:hypothetical protein [Microbacterium thalli]|uniref:hypothetical protein n=1 Tax=Microbacterium thalli TaxID=3027921 RepID=UPI00236713A6|nr:hypothetical protein [Microbacterium thalli]MDD7930053.1 hypothetical protein [Microbacterium thalli]